MSRKSEINGRWGLKKMLAGVSAGALLVAFCVPALAADDDTKAEIRLLKEQLHRLEKKLEVTVAKQDAEARKPHKGDSLFVKGPAPEPVAEDSFHFRGLTITPGGFFALESVRRSNWVGADVNTPFQNIPYGFQPAGHTDEFRFSARPTRPILKLKGDIDPETHIQGYMEMDFLGAAQTANSNQSNSYNLRMRQLYSNIDWDNWGAHFAAGQMWSLGTTNSVGIKPDTSLQPPTIDHQYMPGYFWARQPGLRVTKDFNKEFWVAASLEGAAQTFYTTPALIANDPGWKGGPFGLVTTPYSVWPAGYLGPYVFGTPASGGLYNSANNYTFSRMPDIIAKAAWDAKWLPDRKLHIEGFGIVRDFTDRSLWGNQNVWGGGGGGSVVVEIAPKLLDFQASGAVGRGIGRYGAGGLNDAAIAISGAPLPVAERMIMIGATLHPTPVTDVYGFAGGEFQNANPQYYGAPAGNIARTPLLVAAGYGNPLYSNWGCNIENEFANNGTNVAATAPFTGTACSGNIKDVKQATGGIWHTFYQGPVGKIKVGLQYSYTKKDGFWSYMGGAPSGHESMVLTSFRYYPFD